MLKNITILVKFVLKVIKNLPISSENLLTRFLVLREVSKLTLPEYRFKWPQMEWWYDKSFNQYLNRFDELDGMNADRKWMLYQLMRLTENIPGDTAECGVYYGSSSYLMCQINAYYSLQKRHHHIFDSFAGLSQPTSIDGRHWQKGDMSCSLEIVQNKLADCQEYTLYKGWIPERFKDVEDKKFAFVHIDVDLYQPTKESLEFFYWRMNSNGIILCDDYGFTSCPGATKAIDEFLTDKPEKMIALSGGGGFLIKGLKTGSTVPI